MPAMTRRTFVAGALTGAPLTALPATAQLADRPITLTHRFAAGGNEDVVTRIVADALARQLGAAFVVEARPGAGGTLAAAALSRAAPDLRTLGVLPGGHAVSAAIYRQLSFDPIDGFRWIRMISDFPFVVTTHRNHPAQSASQLVAMAKDAKEPLLWGSAGNGTGQHMAGELLASMAGVRLRHVPYRGGAQAILDLLGERIDFMVDSPTVMMEHVSAGRLRALAATGKERFFALPDVPTLDEVAVRGYETTSWLGLAAPKGVSDKQIADLNKALSDALASPVTASRRRAVGSVPRPTTPGQFRDRVAADIAKWKRVVETTQIERI